MEGKKNEVTRGSRKRKEEKRVVIKYGKININGKWYREWKWEEKEAKVKNKEEKI